MNKSTFYEDWKFLEDHPIFVDQHGLGRFQRCLDIEVIKFNPLTSRVEKKKALNTKVRIWLECGPWLHPDNFPKELREFNPGWEMGMNIHSKKLDCGGDTFEIAIAKLAKLVSKHYGTNRKNVKA